MDSLASVPGGFWLSAAMLIGLGSWGWARRREAWGIPLIAVCGTVLAWYHGDAVYNGYGALAERFIPDVLDAAWLEVAWFTVCLAVFVRPVHCWFNASHARNYSSIVGLIDGRGSLQGYQRLLTAAFGGLTIIWLVLVAIALIRTDFDWLGLFAPWLGRKAYPWTRGRIGGGLDFLFSLIGYLNILCSAGFGVTATLAKSTLVRRIAIVLMALSWPSVLLDRARNVMLAVCLPALFCLVCLRLRRRWLVQAVVLVVAFLVIESWFGFVLKHRSSRSVAEAFSTSSGRDLSGMRHLGLNMFEELCWINSFLHDGLYQPNWGYRYFADVANVIPRSLWYGKPRIGLDYAIARGHGTRSLEGVNTTIATGMIGQGVVNFGPWGGPMAAALLMSFWCALLARFDLMGARFGRLLLYSLGLTLTFNLGRDITLLVVYPLLFGWTIMWALERRLASPRYR